MPGMYAPKDYDLAGFAIGAAQRSSLLPREDIEIHDVIIGLASDGIHSNGFSLVRNVLRQQGLELNDPSPFDHAGRIVHHHAAIPGPLPNPMQPFSTHSPSPFRRCACIPIHVSFGQFFSELCGMAG